MTLFYAYAKHAHDDWSARYLIVFASRAIADEWWRAVSTSPVASFPASIRRISPQFYTHDPSRALIADSLTKPNVATQFLDSVFFTLLNDRAWRAVNVIPPLKITDHISGNWFYVRSGDNNSVYWYVTPNGQIVASRTQSTRFRVSTVDKQLHGKVMVRDDKVYITQHGNNSLHISETGSLQSGSKSEAFRFGDLFDGFRINAYGSEILAGVSANAIVATKENDAEEWELSNTGLFGDMD